MTLDEATQLIVANATAHQHKAPTLGTLSEEIAELARAMEGTHEHSPGLELVQIGGIAINLLRQYDAIEITAELEMRDSDKEYIPTNDAEDRYNRSA